MKDCIKSLNKDNSHWKSFESLIGMICLFKVSVNESTNTVDLNLNPTYGLRNRAIDLQRAVIA